MVRIPSTLKVLSPVSGGRSKSKNRKTRVAREAAHDQATLFPIQGSAAPSRKHLLQSASLQSTVQALAVVPGSVVREIPIDRLERNRSRRLHFDRCRRVGLVRP